MVQAHLRCEKREKVYGPMGLFKDDGGRYDYTKPCPGVLEKMYNINDEDRTAVYRCNVCGRKKSSHDAK